MTYSFSLLKLDSNDYDNVEIDFVVKCYYSNNKIVEQCRFLSKDIIGIDIITKKEKIKNTINYSKKYNYLMTINPSKYTNLYFNDGEDIVLVKAELNDDMNNYFQNIIRKRSA